MGVVEHMVGELVAARRRKAQRAASREGEGPAVAAASNPEGQQEAPGRTSADGEDSPSQTRTTRLESAGI